MSQEAALLERYYRAFSALDAQAMAACYTRRRASATRRSPR